MHVHLPRCNATMGCVSLPVIGVTISQIALMLLMRLTVVRKFKYPHSPSPISEVNYILYWNLFTLLQTLSVEASLNVTMVNALTKV